MSGRIPIAAMMTSASMVTSEPGMGVADRRPDASGSPRRISTQRSPETAPSALPRTSSGATSSRKATPSFSASAASTWWAGISSRERR